MNNQKMLAVKDIAPLFGNDVTIRVCGDYIGYDYNADNTLDVVTYGNMCVRKIDAFTMERDGKIINYVDLHIALNPVMCG